MSVGAAKGRKLIPQRSGQMTALNRQTVKQEVVADSRPKARKPPKDVKTKQ